MHTKDQTCVNNVISFSASGQCDHILLVDETSRPSIIVYRNLFHISRQYNHCPVQKKIKESFIFDQSIDGREKLPFKFFICGR